MVIRLRPLVHRQASLGLALGAVLALLMAAQAAAAGRVRCLLPEERRLAIARHEAVPLGRVVGQVRGRHGEVVGARLCETDGGLVYMLTVLSRSGKVTRPTVDAVSGQLRLGR